MNYSILFRNFTIACLIGNFLFHSASVLMGNEESEFIQQIINNAYKNGQPKVVIPSGIYHIAAPEKQGKHLYFSGMKNFEIDATDVTLVFTTRNKGSIGFNQCENVTLRGATLLRKTIPFSQGKITAISPDGKLIDVKIDTGYPTDFDDPKFYSKISLHIYNPQTRQWIDDKDDATSIERLGPDSFRFHSNRPVNTKMGWVVGAAVAWRGGTFADIDINSSKDMKILDVSIKGGTGFCIHEHSGDGGNYYRYTVTYGAKPDGATEMPLMASNADAFHSSDVRKGPTLEDCFFEGMNDDGVPIHGQYGLLQKAEGNQVVVELRYPPFYQAGDNLRFIDERGSLADNAKVTNAEILADYTPDAPPPTSLRLFQNTPHPKFVRLTLDHAVAAKFGWLIANVDRVGSGFTVRRCTIRNNRARGILIKASNGLIEDCTIEGSSMGAIVIAPEMNTWNESDYACNLIIRRNRFRTCNYWPHPGNNQAGTLTLAAFEYNHYVPLPAGHRNIVIEDNTFENNNGTNILVSSAQDIIIRNNRFIRPMQQSNEHGKAHGVNPNALVWLTECSGVQIMGNTVSEAGDYLKTAVDTTPTATGSGFDNGITITK